MSENPSAPRDEDAPENLNPGPPASDEGPFVNLPSEDVAGRHSSNLQKARKQKTAACLGAIVGGCYGLTFTLLAGAAPTSVLWAFLGLVCGAAFGFLLGLYLVYTKAWTIITGLIRGGESYDREERWEMARLAGSAFALLGAITGLVIVLSWAHDLVQNLALFVAALTAFGGGVIGYYSADKRLVPAEEDRPHAIDYVPARRNLRPGRNGLIVTLVAIFALVAGPAVVALLLKVQERREAVATRDGLAAEKAAADRARLEADEARRIAERTAEDDKPLEVCNAPHLFHYRCLAFHPSDRILAAGGGTSDSDPNSFMRINPALVLPAALSVWTTDTWRLNRLLVAAGRDDHPTVSSVAYSPFYNDPREPWNGNLLAAARNGELCVWNTQYSEDTRFRMPDGLPYYARYVAFSPVRAQGEKVLAISGSSDILLFDVESGKVTKTLKFTKEIEKKLNRQDYRPRALTFDPFGSLLVADGVVWNPHSGNVVTSLLHGSTLCAAFSHDGRTLVTADADGKTVRVWDCDGWKERKVISSRLARFAYGALGFSKDGTLAMPGDDGRIRLLNLDRGWVDADLPCGADALQFSPDGKFLATATDGDVKIWDVEKRRQVHRERHIRE